MTRRLRCLRRGDRLARVLARCCPPFLWRLGWKSAYGWEQFTFWLSLWPRLVHGRFDILHVQDPMVAYWCNAFRRAGLVRTKEILAHGTEEPVEFLRRFEFVQHLAPWHLEQARESLDRRGTRGGGRHWTAMPNFVDCETFCPAGGKRQGARETLGIPQDAFVVGCVAAVKSDHKRVDYVIREVSGFRCQESGVGGQEAYLLVAGARTDESDELVRLAEELIPGRHKIMTDVARDQMPDLYRAMDVFVLPSLFEMMPIAVIEAMASGVPVILNRHPVLEWMSGTEEMVHGSWFSVEKSEQELAERSPADSPHPAPTTQGDISPQRSLERNALAFRPARQSAPLQEDGTCVSAGTCIAMNTPGELAKALAGLSPEWLETHARSARERALAMFSKESVIGQYVEYYKEVLSDDLSSLA